MKYLSGVFMGKYKVTFKKQTTGGDTREYSILVEANTLGSAEEVGLRQIANPHAKAFLTANDILRIEQVE
jgi:hypothetical protein